MTLKEYFENSKGVGVFSTADASGKVDSAVYARPHFLIEGDDNTVAWVMADHLSHANLQSNENASYLFIEAGEGYHGKRLTLKKIKEVEDKEAIARIKQHCVPSCCNDDTARFLVYFQVERVRPLVGGE